MILMLIIVVLLRCCCSCCCADDEKVITPAGVPLLSTFTCIYWLDKYKSLVWQMSLQCKIQRCAKIKRFLTLFHVVNLTKNASPTASEEEGWHREHGTAAMTASLIEAPRRPQSNDRLSAYRFSALEHLENDWFCFLLKNKVCDFTFMQIWMALLCFQNDLFY